jgi:hypothetical protein
MIEQRECLDMFSTFHILFILSTALSAIAIPPKGDAVTGISVLAPVTAPARNRDTFDYPNKDCIIIPTQGGGGCPEPQKCHKAGGLCFAPDPEMNLDKRTVCRQGNVDLKTCFGYRVQKWKTASQSIAIRRHCAGCQCRARKPRIRNRKRPTNLGNKSDTPEPFRRVRTKYPIAPDEIERTFQQIQNEDSSASEDDRTVPNRAVTVGTSYRRGQTISSDRDTPSMDPSSSPLDEGEPPNRAIPHELENPAESEDDSHPPLFQNPTYFNPNYQIFG